MIPARAITNPSTRSLEMLAGPRGLFDQDVEPFAMRHTPFRITTSTLFAPGVDEALAVLASLAPAGTNRVEKRRLEREAKEVAAKKEAEDIKVEIEKVSTIPEGAKMPKKPAEACELGRLRSQRGVRPAGQRVRVQPALCGSSVRPGSAAALQPIPRLRSHYARHRQRVG